MVLGAALGGGMGGAATALAYVHANFLSKSEADKRGEYRSKEIALLHDDMIEVQKDVKEILRRLPRE